MDEKEIQNHVAQSQQGDRESAGKLFDHFYPRVYRFLALRVDARETAEDLAQNVFLEMVRSLKNYQPRKQAKFSTWLFQIARHRLIDHYRAKRQSVSIDDVNESDSPGLIVEQMMPDLDTRTKSLWKEMAKLPEKYQTILYLHFSEGLKIVEIAKVMKITSINARVLKSRALRKLKQKINKQ